MDVLYKLIAESYSSGAAEACQKFAATPTQLEALRETGQDVLDHFPYVPGACAPMSALFLARWEMTPKPTAYVVAGELYIGDTRIFGDDGRGGDPSSAFKRSNPSWDGHCWLQFGDHVADVSLLRTARSRRSHPALRNLVQEKLGPKAALVIAKTGALEELGLRYRPQYVLTKAEVDSLLLGAKSLIEYLLEHPHEETPAVDQDSAFESVLNYRPPSTAIHLDEREPEHEDPSRELRDHEWQGADETTSRLTRCLEAGRDITDVIAGLAAAGDPARDKRALKHAILPIHNLAVALAELATDIQRNHAWKLPPAERHSLVRVVRDFRKAVPTEKGVLHALRNQLAAHLTDEMFTSEYRRLWESFSVADVLGWVRSCVRTLECLLVPDVFMWTRESGQENLMSLMTEDGKEELCYVANNEPAGVHSVRIVRSPKEAITREIRALSASCSALSRRLGINEGTRWKPPG